MCLLLVVFICIFSLVLTFLFGILLNCARLTKILYFSIPRFCSIDSVVTADLLYLSLHNKTATLVVLYMFLAILAFLRFLNRIS